MEAQGINTELRVASTNAIHEKEDQKVYYEGWVGLQKKVKQFAEILLDAKSKGCPIVIYTGAGISTSASLPDYRGPKGLWTIAKEEGTFDDRKERTLDNIKPTFCHCGISSLVANDFCHAVVTTNVDCLHLKSGVPREKLFEIHGNAFVEKCPDCKSEYLRDHDVVGGIGNIEKKKETGNLCENCSAKLVNNIIQFGEFLDSVDYEKASGISWNAGVSLVIGSSLHVAPANQLPTYSFKKNGGHFLICNLQNTPLTEFATCQIYGETDDFMFLLLQELGVVIDSCQYNCASFQSNPDELKLKYDEKQTAMAEPKSSASENVVKYKKAHVNLLAEVKALKKI